MRWMLVFFVTAGFNLFMRVQAKFFLIFADENRKVFLSIENGGQYNESRI